MSKQINPTELATIVTKLLTTHDSAGELAEASTYQSFMTQIAQVVCDHCGGEIRNKAEPLDDVWYVGIHGNDSLPSSGGIWSPYDSEGELFSLKEVLPGACQAEITHVMMQDVVGDYDTPDEIPEWKWVEDNASFAHVNNGEHGVWEFVLNLARGFTDVPDRLKPILQRASADGMAYVIFHQGT